MAGPDFPRPPIEDQLGLGVARQQGDEYADKKLPDGCEVNGWKQVSAGGMWLASGGVRTPDGNYGAQYMYGGTDGIEGQA